LIGPKRPKKIVCCCGEKVLEKIKEGGWNRGGAFEDKENFWEKPAKATCHGKRGGVMQKGVQEGARFLYVSTLE